MHYVYALLAGAVAGAASVFTSWFITGVLFHRFQALTPASWRPEGAKQYALASLNNFVACLLTALLFAATGGLPGLAPLIGTHWFVQGLIFALLAWSALAVPVLFSISIFVNIHRGMVVGLLLDWLVVILMASLAAAWAVRG